MQQKINTKQVSKRNIKTESIEATMSRKGYVKSTVEVKTEGKGCWEDEPKIDVGLTSSGTVIVHTCKEIFMRKDELGEIETVVADSGIEYVMIKFINR